MLKWLLFSLREGFLKSNLDPVGLQLCSESGRASEHNFEAIEDAAADLFVDSCLMVVVLVELTDFLHSLLLLHFHFARDSANLEQIHDHEHVVDRTSQRLQTNLVVGRVREVTRDDLVIQNGVSVLLDSQSVVGCHF